MTGKEKINRNIGVTFDFLKEVIKNPEVLRNIPDGSTLEFVDKDFPTIEKKNKPHGIRKRKYFRVTSHLEVIK